MGIQQCHWITPAIPLIILYCEQFPEGPERVHSLIAFQLTLGILSLILGATGLAAKVVSLIPSALKTGVIMGAGIAAVISVLELVGVLIPFHGQFLSQLVSGFIYYSRNISLIFKNEICFGERLPS